MDARTGAEPPLERPPTAGRAWTSFIADDPDDDRPVRALHEMHRPDHRLRVEHDRHTLLIHLSGEEGGQWTTFAVDRATRRWAGGQGRRQTDSSRAAFDALYGAAGDHAEPAPTAAGLPKIGAPATRALQSAGYASLQDLAGASRADLLRLHGMGPKAIGILEAELARRGLQLD